MKKNFPAITFTIILIIGLLTFNQYGESWDDRSLQKYAEKSINAYVTFPQQGMVQIQREDLGYYGPFFVMLTAQLSNFLSQYFNYQLVDLRHLIYFLTYFAGALAFYQIAKRWLNQIPALGAALLFTTQPLLWGHAFMNPKDTPFLSLFLLSISFGLKIFDSLHLNQLNQLDSRPKRILTLLTTFWLVSVSSLFIFTEAIQTYITSLVLSAQAGDVNIISMIAKNISGVSVDIYVQRYFLLFLQSRAIFFLLSSFLLLLIYYRLQPNLLKILLAVLPAGILLGFTTSTRILGPFAGLIIIYYALRIKGKQAIPALAIYAVIASITTYLTWPYLWMNPVSHFVESFREMSLYPWGFQVLFNGVMYPATDLPLSYLPTLLLIQFSEPVWVLAIAGWIVAIRGEEKKRELVELSALWFIIPLVAFIIFRIALYDNFRQILFIIPPIFLMAGVAFEKIKNIKWQIALISLCLIPSIFGIIKLHPYEYIYYNAFAGNTAGRFEHDYWVTSYREAAEYVNRVASPNANIWVEVPAQLFSIFAREDLKIYSPSEIERVENYEYIVSTTRFDSDKKSYLDIEIVYEIKRGDFILSVVKKP